MDNASACSLVSYINGNSARYSAWPITFGERAWVILRDAHAAHTVPCEEPILDVHGYLGRLERRHKSQEQKAELHNLLGNWLSVRHDENRNP